MLTSFTVERFKSYNQEATLRLAPLTVLIGANASGKSNVVEALRLLSWIAQGNKLGAISHTVQGDNQAIRGAVKDLAFRRQRTFELACSSTHPQWDKYSVRLSCNGDAELLIADERVSGADQGTPLFQVAESRAEVGDLRVAYNNFARGGRKPLVTCNNQMSLLAHLQSPALFAKHHRVSRRTIPAIASQYVAWMSSIVFLDPRPSQMRGYSFKTDGELDGSGGNLSGVLYGLCRKKGGRKQQILDMVKALPEQDINDIDFIQTPRGEAMVTLTETFGGRQTRYDATLLSDGTLRVLAIGAALLTAPKGRLVVIEEIDNGVHPSRAGALIEQILAIAKDRDLRVLLSSHNPALLDATPDEAIGDVAFCYRDDRTGASRLTRLADIPAYPELVAQAPIGRLMTRGTIRRFVQQTQAPALRRRKARAWLDRLRDEADSAD